MGKIAVVARKRGIAHWAVKSENGMSLVKDELGQEARKLWTAPKLEQIEMRRTQEGKLAGFECPSIPVGLNPGSPIICGVLS